MTREELEAEVERLRAQNADLRMMIDGLETAAHEERAAVVAWLREEADKLDRKGDPEWGVVADLALYIKAGKHRREEE